MQRQREWYINLGNSELFSVAEVWGVEWEETEEKLNKIGFWRSLNTNEFHCCSLYKGKILRNFELVHHNKYGYLVSLVDPNTLDIL